jgi:hypothetical protein
MSKKLLSSNPIEKKKTYLASDSDGLSIVTETDTSNLLKYNREENNNWRPGSMIGNTQKHIQPIANIPTAIYYNLLEKFGPVKNNPKAWRKWLNDPDHKAFRTTGGKV